MAILNFLEILEIFKTGKKPTEEEFANTWSSFWHKYELIKTNNIEFFDSRSKFIPFGVFKVFKAPGNNNPENKYIIEIGDIVNGMFDPDIVVWGKFMGGDPTVKENYAIAQEIDFTEFILPPPTPPQDPPIQ